MSNNCGRKVDVGLGLNSFLFNSYLGKHYNKAKHRHWNMSCDEEV